MKPVKWRLEKAARRKLLIGKDDGAIIHDLVRFSGISREEARQVVDRVKPEVQDLQQRRLRRYFRAGVLLLFIPLAFLVTPVSIWIFFPDSPLRTPWTDLVQTFVFVPFLSIPTVLGVFFSVYGWPGRRRRYSLSDARIDR